MPALGAIVGAVAIAMLTLFACAPTLRPVAELPMAAPDQNNSYRLGVVPPDNIVPDHETAEAIAVAVSRPVLAYTDNLEFTQFLPFSADLEGDIWTVFSQPVQPKDWGPCSESMFFFVRINRHTGEVIDFNLDHSEGGLNSDTPACQAWMRERAEPYSESAIAYFQALGKVCPEKNLDRLAPGQLESVVEQFRKTLSVLENNSFDSWSQTTCAANDLTCTNGGYLRAARDLSMARRLAEKACASSFVCRSDGMACEETNPPK